MLDIKNSFHFRLISYLFVLMPVTLLTGPFLPDLFLSLLALYFLFISLKFKLFGYYKSIFVYLFSFFYFYLLIRGIFSQYPYESLIKYNGPIFYFRYLFFVLGIKFILDVSPEFIKKFTFSLLLVIIFCCIDGFFQWIFGFNLFGFKSPSIRVTGIFGSEEILGHFLSHVTPLLIALLTFLYGVNKKKILLYISILMLSEIMIFISNDRAGFLKIFQFTLLLIILSSHFKIFRLISFIISIIIISILINFAPDSSTRFEHTLRDVSSTTIPYMPWAPSHETHFSVAFDMFFNNPIFGQGPQLFKTLCHITPEYLDACTSHPHNYYVQTLGELGLVGISFLILGFLYSSFVLIKHFIALWFTKNKKNLLSDYYLFLMCFIFLILWPLIPHQSFYNNWLNVMLYLPVGFALYFKK
ncbi:O-antigen ligase family protein [Alphaproteobacteria bacterium]|nr:O-antigen ligase family protein [Alphaproteobacteria bacterium]